MLFLGMTGAFSLPPLQALIDAGIDVCGVLVAGEGRLHRVEPGTVSTGLPVLTRFVQPNIVHLAWKNAIPVFEVGVLEATPEVAALQPDVIAAACFPRLVPRRFRALATLGAVNVHPSLLPENRGPDPIYWTLRLGHPRTGVTVHLMTDRADAGAILAQEPVVVPAGVSPEDLEQMCAQLGGRLLARAVRDLGQGTAVPRPQDESRATYYGFRPG